MTIETDVVIADVVKAGVCGVFRRCLCLHTVLVAGSGSTRVTEESGQALKVTEGNYLYGNGALAAAARVQVRD
jgi:hypothetical protein